jgi:predicted dehydrogenase
LVVVATQDPYHKEPVIEACKSNVPYIICEKPLATNVLDAKEMVKAAIDNDAKVYVNFPNRFFPLDNAIRTVVRKGFIGEPCNGEFRMDNSIAVPLFLWGKDSKNFASISNPAHFLLSHAIDLLRFYFDPQEICKVYAIGQSKIIGSKMDYIDAFLKFNNGLTIRLKSEWTKHMKAVTESFIQLTGSKGGFVYNRRPGYGCKQGLRFDFNDKEETVKQIQKLLYKDGIKSNIHIESVFFPKIYPVEMPSDGLYRNALELYTDEGNDFSVLNVLDCHVDNILNNRKDSYRFVDVLGGYAQVKVVEAIFESIATDKEIDISY